VHAGQTPSFSLVCFCPSLVFLLYYFCIFYRPDHEPIMKLEGSKHVAANKVPFVDAKNNAKGLKPQKYKFQGENTQNRHFKPNLLHFQMRISSKLYWNWISAQVSSQQENFVGGPVLANNNGKWPTNTWCSSYLTHEACVNRLMSSRSRTNVEVKRSHLVPGKAYIDIKYLKCIKQPKQQHKLQTFAAIKQQKLTIIHTLTDDCNK